MNKRILSMDYAKGIGILLVIAGHIPTLYAPVGYFITSFHMPLFFILSGWLLAVTREKQGDMKEFILKKWNSVMLPYFFFSTCSILLESALWLAGRRQGSSILWMIYNMFNLSGSSVFWFLPTLFLSQIMVVYILKKISYKWLPAFMLLFLIGGYGCVLLKHYMEGITSEFPRIAFLLPFVIVLARSFLAAGFIAFGYLGAFCIADRQRLVWTGIFLTPVLLCVTGLISAKTGGMDLNCLVIPMPLLNLVGAVTGSLSVIFICLLFAKWKTGFLGSFLEFFGKHSLLVMVTHIPFYVMYVAVKLGDKLQSLVVLQKGILTLFIFFTVVILEAVLVVGMTHLLRKVERRITENRDGR